jgi:hypothetical protein
MKQTPFWNTEIKISFAAISLVATVAFQVDFQEKYWFDSSADLSNENRMMQTEWTKCHINVLCSQCQSNFSLSCHVLPMRFK